MNRDQVIEYIQAVKFGYLATINADNEPCVRPVAINNIYGDDLYFFTFCNTRKVSEIDSNPQVEVVWSKLAEASQVRIRGKALVVDDPSVQQRFRQDNPMVDKMLPKGAEHLFRLYKIEPQKVYAAQGLVPYSEVDW
ncbi:MAG: pyridoxamine 5'-phosphate oxidase family protein [Anaerolineales bacterium]|nr:pyridoxamine 5'-phosphate oxidase family protein [Anaerolineales bacterium]